MRTERIHIVDGNLSIISYDRYKMNGADNSDERMRMKRVLSKAIQNELTDRQRYCITQYYLMKRPQKEIADELGLNISTVSRHVNAARKKLRDIAACYSI